MFDVLMFLAFIVIAFGPAIVASLYSIRSSDERF